jgi:hypothetical protein
MNPFDEVEALKSRNRSLEQELESARTLLGAFLWQVGKERGDAIHEVRIDESTLVAMPRDFVLKRWDDPVTKQTVFQLLAEDSDVRV